MHIWSDREGGRSLGTWAGGQPSAASDPGERRGQDEGVVVPVGTRDADAVLLGTGVDDQREGAPWNSPQETPFLQQSTRLSEAGVC